MTEIPGRASNIARSRKGNLGDSCAKGDGTAPVTTFSLPIPPSLNNCFPTNTRTGRRFKSAEYKRWEEHAGFLLQNVKAIGGGPYALCIVLPEKMRGDISNRIKAVEDLLVAHGITSDDSKCWDVRAMRGITQVPGWCEVTVGLV